MALVGDYHYSSAILAGQRYAIIRNGPILERVRRIAETDNPIVWQQGDPLSSEVLDILANEQRG